MEDNLEHPTFADVKALAPRKGEKLSKAVNGLGNGLMVATPAFLVLESAAEKGSWLNRHLPEKIVAFRVPISISIGCAAALAGIAQGVHEAHGLQRYRKARMNYTQSIDERVAALENGQKNWQTRTEPPAAEDKGRG